MFDSARLTHRRIWHYLKEERFSLFFHGPYFCPEYSRVAHDNNNTEEVGIR